MNNNKTVSAEMLVSNNKMEIIRIAESNESCDIKEFINKITFKVHKNPSNEFINDVLAYTHDCISYRKDDTLNEIDMLSLKMEDMMEEEEYINKDMQVVEYELMQQEKERINSRIDFLEFTINNMRNINI